MFPFLPIFLLLLFFVFFLSFTLCDIYQKKKTNRMLNKNKKKSNQIKYKCTCTYTCTCTYAHARAPLSRHRQTLSVLIKQLHESTACPTNCFTTGDANAAAGPAAAALDVAAHCLSSAASSACADLMLL